MRKLAITIAAWLLVGGSLATPLQAADTKSTPPPLALKVGDVAPDFKLQFFDGTDLKDHNQPRKKNYRRTKRQRRHRPHKNRRRMRAPQAEELTMRSEVAMMNSRGGAVW